MNLQSILGGIDIVWTNDDPTVTPVDACCGSWIGYQLLDVDDNPDGSPVWYHKNDDGATVNVSALFAGGRADYGALTSSQILAIESPSSLGIAFNIDDNSDYTYHSGTWYSNGVPLFDAGGSGVATASVSDPGSYIGADGDYGAFHTSGGLGIGAAFTLTLSGGVIVNPVVSIDSSGSGYSVSEKLGVSIIGVSEFSPCEINVDSVG